MTSPNSPEEKEVRIRECDEGFLVTLEDPSSPLETEHSEQSKVRAFVEVAVALSLVAIPILIAIFAPLFRAFVLCSANAGMCAFALYLLRRRGPKVEPLFYLLIFYGVLSSLVSGIVLFARWLH